MIMTGGGYATLPDGSVIVALTLPRPHARAGANRSRRRSAEPERRRWSAVADEPHTVRAAAPRRRGEEARVRVLVHSANRARALTRLRNSGLRAVYLRGNTEPPTADEITAVLHHPEGLVWRTASNDDRESWHPIAALLRVGTA